MDKEYTYHLSDDMGISTIYLPIVLNVGTQFEHEFGLYKVEHIEHDDKGDIMFLCERIDNSQHLTNQIVAGKNFHYNK